MDTYELMVLLKSPSGQACKVMLDVRQQEIEAAKDDAIGLLRNRFHQMVDSVFVGKNAVPVHSDEFPKRQGILVERLGKKS